MTSSNGKIFPRYWPFVQGIHGSSVISPHKGQWRRVLLFSLICVWVNGCVNIDEIGDSRRHRAHYDAIVMLEGVISTRLIKTHWNNASNDDFVIKQTYDQLNALCSQLHVINYLTQCNQMTHMLRQMLLLFQSEL